MPDNGTMEMERRKRGRPPKVQKEAPNVSIVDDVYRDPRRKKLDEYVSTEAKRQKWDAAQVDAWLKSIHFFFSRVDVDKDMMEAEGYLPAMRTREDGTKTQVSDRGDLLWIIDRELWQQRMDAPGDYARQLLTGELLAKNPDQEALEVAPD